MRLHYPLRIVIDYWMIEKLIIITWIFKWLNILNRDIQMSWTFCFPQEGDRTTLKWTASHIYLTQWFQLSFPNKWVKFRCIPQIQIQDLVEGQVRDSGFWNERNHLLFPWKAESTWNKCGHDGLMWLAWGPSLKQKVLESNFREA